MPVRSNAPSPQYRRRWTVSSNSVPTTSRVGVVELDPDDPVQRDGSEVGDRRVSTIDVPHVDDDAPCVVPGVLDELQAVVQRLDVRPREELDPEPGADVVGLRRELGELRRPVLAVPRRIVAVGGHLEVPGAERLRRLEKGVRIRSDSARCGPSSHQYGIPSSSRSTMPLSSSIARIPPARIPAGRRQVGGQQPEAAKPPPTPPRSARAAGAGCAGPHGRMRRHPRWTSMWPGDVPLCRESSLVLVGEFGEFAAAGDPTTAVNLTGAVPRWQQIHTRHTPPRGGEEDR